MKPTAANPTLPPPAKMADALLSSSSQMILDHYSATQGRRVLQLMQSNPSALLAEMFQAMRQLNLTQLAMARARGEDWTKPGDRSQSEIPLEAYQSLYPAVWTPAADEMTPAQRQKLDDWLVSFGPAPAE